MQEILEVSCRPVHDGIWTPAELMGALERAATDHADALNIGHDRMVADFGSLWMLVRSRLELTRLPAADEALTVRTWLRSPTPVMSVRDYDFCADGEVIGSAGPTTSGRMDAMSPRLLDLGNKIMIGKGKRDAAVKEAVVRNGAVYLAALGGAGALMAQSVQTLEVIAWPDLGCEAVRRLTVEKMPLTVILDAHGGDLYEAGPAAYLETVK